MITGRTVLEPLGACRHSLVEAELVDGRTRRRSSPLKPTVRFLMPKSRALLVALSAARFAWARVPDRCSERSNVCSGLVGVARVSAWLTV